MTKMAHNQPVAHMVDYYLVRVREEIHKNGRTDYAEDLAARYGYYSHASTHMEILCEFHGGEDIWAHVSVVDNHGRVWQDRELSLSDYSGHVVFFEDIANKMKGYRHYWIEGKE